MTGNTMWRTSSYSGGSGGDCVEVRDDTGRVLVRDTKDRTGPVLPFTPQAWQRFADRVKHSLAGPQAKHPRAPLSLQGAHPACTGLFLVPSCSATPCAFSTVMCGGFACSSLPVIRGENRRAGEAGMRLGNLEPGRGFPGRKFQGPPVRFWIGPLLPVVKLSRSVPGPTTGVDRPGNGGGAQRETDRLTLKVPSRLPRPVIFPSYPADLVCAP